MDALVIMGTFFLLLAVGVPVAYTLGLMVGLGNTELAIALGIGACMTTLTVFHVLSGDPIPQKSARLFYVQMDPEGKQGYQPGGDPQDQMTRFDAEA